MKNGVFQKICPQPPCLFFFWNSPITLDRYRQVAGCKICMQSKKRLHSFLTCLQLVQVLHFISSNTQINTKVAGVIYKTILSYLLQLASYLLWSLQSSYTAQVHLYPPSVHNVTAVSCQQASRQLYEERAHNPQQSYRLFLLNYRPNSKLPLKTFEY